MWWFYSAQPKTLENWPAPRISEGMHHPAGTPPKATQAIPASAPADKGQLEIKSVQQIFSQKELYPFLMRMHGARGVGSWAAGAQLLHECVKAESLLNSPNPQTFTNGEVTAPIRLDAKSKLEMRCLNMPAGILDQYEPRSDDENAQKYRAAKLFLTRRQFSDKNKVIDAIRELARQKKLEEAAPILKLAKVWNGESWSGDDSDFNQIVDAAVELATAEPGNEKDDIRLIWRCYFNARCDYQYGAIEAASTPAETERRKKIAQEMADAMRRGDVERILSLKH